MRELGFQRTTDKTFLYLLLTSATAAECVEAGFDQKFVIGGWAGPAKSNLSGFPPVAKVSNRTVGYDFLYLRDWERRT